MDDQYNFEEIEELIQLDYDAIQAYEHAIEKVDSEPIREALTSYMQDHKRHVTELSQALESHGRTPPEQKKDLKGQLIEGMTALQSAFGTKAALMAMKTNENLTNKKYDNAVKERLPEDLRRLVEKGLKDERRHLRFIENVLDRKLWEHPEEINEMSYASESSTL